MDEVSEGGKKAKKKKSASTHTIKNFGTALNIAKAKSSSSIALAWRCRLLLFAVCATYLCVSGCHRTPEISFLRTSGNIFLLKNQGHHDDN